MKKAVTMQDISCVGKCSLTVALPVLSAMGIETAVLPTAVLSTHTMFRGFTFHDLTSELRPILAHWKQENFQFDAVYTGYLGSFEQIAIARELFQDFGRNKLKIVDPCMADEGKFYPGFDQSFADEMASLCRQADLICPNLSETAFLLHQPYLSSYTEEDIHKALKDLTALGCHTAVITGVSLQPGSIGACAYDDRTGSYTSYFTGEEGEHFHGTGDLWASTLCGALVNGRDLSHALAIACQFIRKAIRLTLAEPGHNTYGVNFEEAIPYLLQLLKEE
jgi:pyridoxine kinase